MLSSLRAKILAGFTAVAILNIVFGLWSIIQLSTVGDATVELVTSTYLVNTITSRMVNLVDNQVEQLDRMYRVHDRRQYTQRFDSNDREFQKALDTLVSGSLVHGRESNIHDIYGAYIRFNTHSTNYRFILTGLIDGRPLQLLRDSIDPAVAALKQQLSYLLLRPPLELSRLQMDVDSYVRRALVFIVVGAIAATVVGLVGGGYYTRWIVRPIIKLMQAVRDVAGGRLDMRIYIASNDELGDLSFEFNRMVERLRSFEEINIDQLLLEKRKTEAIVQAIATPIVVVDADMTVLLINSSAVRLLRLDDIGVVDGMDLTTLEQCTDIVPLLRQSMTSEFVVRQDPKPHVFIRQQEGRDAYYSVAALPLTTTSAVRGAVAVFSDVTHFKELERLKSDFLARVSHEFRTPLSSITLGIDLLQEEVLGALNDAQHDILVSSKDDCRRLSKLIGDILELSRVESRRIEKACRTIELEALVVRVVKAHALEAKERGVQIRWTIGDTVPAVWGDAEEFYWMIGNLVSNAIRHTRETDIVSICIDSGLDGLMIEVADTGEGIPTEDLGRIFDRFHQVGGRSITVPGSVGLGLAIVKEVVESYGGCVAATSAVGQGSTFAICIPLERLRDRNDIEDEGNREER